MTTRCGVRTRARPSRSETLGVPIVRRNVTFGSLREGAGGVPPEGECATKEILLFQNERTTFCFAYSSTRSRGSPLPEGAIICGRPLGKPQVFFENIVVAPTGFGGFLNVIPVGEDIILSPCLTQ